MNDLTTSPGLILAMKQAAQHKMTANEIREQKASFVFGTLGKNNDMTLEEVKEMIARRAGEEVAPA